MIHQLPLSERPRERCLAFGAETLSLRECIAILLGSGPKGKGCMGVAADLMRLSETSHLQASEDVDRHFLTQWLHTGPALLQDISGLGPAQRARLLVCFEIGKRLQSISAVTNIPSSLNLSVLEKRAFNKVSFSERTAREEWFGFIGVFKTGRVTSLQITARGGSQQVTVDKQKLFRELLLTGAPAFILLHNHPSRDLKPSPDDILLTESIRSLAAELSLQLLSHLIVSAESAHSFANGL